MFKIIVSLTAICRVLERALSPRGRCVPRRSGTTNMFSAPTVSVPVHTTRYGAWEPLIWTYERGCLSVGIRVCSLYFKTHLRDMPKAQSSPAMPKVHVHCYVEVHHHRECKYITIESASTSQ